MNEKLSVLLLWIWLVGFLLLGWFLFKPRSTPRSVKEFPDTSPDNKSKQNYLTRYLESRWIPFVVPFIIIVVLPFCWYFVYNYFRMRNQYFNLDKIYNWCLPILATILLVFFMGTLRAGIYQIKKGQRIKGIVTLVLFVLFVVLSAYALLLLVLMGFE